MSLAQIQEELKASNVKIVRITKEWKQKNSVKAVVIVLQNQPFIFYDERLLTTEEEQVKALSDLFEKLKNKKVESGALLYE